MIFKIEINHAESNKSLGQFLRFSRLQSGYSLRDLGSLAKISHTLIANIEQGKVSGSTETLKDLFKCLNASFYDATEYEEEFVRIYDRLFNNLFKYQYTRAKVAMAQLEKKEFIYVNSILITDYTLIKFLYLVLFAEAAEDDYIDLDIFKKISGNFNSRQKQLFRLIVGIDLYNRGLYKDAVEKLESSLRIGISNLDNLAKVFLVKCYVKLFRFMDVIKMGNEVIDFYEDQVFYLRAMEVRLSIANSYILVLKSDDARRLLDSVIEFSNNFNAVYLLEEANRLHAFLNIMEGNIIEASLYLNRLTLNTFVVYNLRLLIAIKRKDKDDVVKIYKEFKNDKNIVVFDHQRMIFELNVKEFGIENMTDDEFISTTKDLIAFGVLSGDLEIIDLAYNFFVEFYKHKRSYKKALEASEYAREFRRYGV